MDGLELVVKATQEELWVEDGRTGARLELPLAFWRSLSEQLHKAGYPQLAMVIEQALVSFQARTLSSSEKFQCMNPIYDEKAQTRCQALLAEDLRPKNPGS